MPHVTKYRHLKVQNGKSLDLTKHKGGSLWCHFLFKCILFIVPTVSFPFNRN